MTLLCRNRLRWESLASSGPTIEVSSVPRLFLFGCKSRFVILIILQDSILEFPYDLQSLADLGLPLNGSDGIFLQMVGKNGWTGEFGPMPEAW